MHGIEGSAQMQKPPQFVADFSTTGQAPSDGRFDAPAFHRNHDPIWQVMEPCLAGRTGEVLEVGSGTGQHVTVFARRSPAITWIPSDHLDAHLNSIAAWRADSGLQNIAAPRRIDLACPTWATAIESERLLAIVCINVLHISPWRVSENLIGEAAKLLRPEGRLFVYGPFKRDGQHTAPSNAAFDRSLREKNPDWGVRDTAELGALAQRCGLMLADIVAMPANNLTLIFAPA
jgi:SAM-dependent methyltransferase